MKSQQMTAEDQKDAKVRGTGMNRNGKRRATAVGIAIVMAISASGFAGCKKKKELGFETPESFSYRFGTVDLCTTAQEGLYLTDGFFYSDDWFRCDPAVQNDELALLSMQLTAASVEGENSRGVKMLTDMGFEETGLVGFDQENVDGFNYTWGKKTITSGSVEYTLVAIAVQSYSFDSNVKRDGWTQNFLVNGETESAEHYAFAKAVDAMYDGILKLAGDGNVKVWIMGHSRGGALTNILAAHLKKDLEKRGHIYAYTFEAPATVESAAVTDNETTYGYIHNYYFSDDIVTLIPPWDMTIYGVKHQVNTKAVMPGIDAELLALKSPNEEKWQEIHGEEFEDGASADGAATDDPAQRFISALTSQIPSRKAYSEAHTDSFTDLSGKSVTLNYTYQDAFTHLMAWAFSEGRSKLNTDELMNHKDVLAESMKHLAKGQVDGSDADILEGSRILSALLAECGMEVPLTEADFYAFLKAVGPAIVDEQALETPPEDTDASEFVMSPVLSRIMELTNCTLSHQFDLSVAGLHVLCKTTPQLSSVNLDVALPEAGGSVSELEGKIKDASAVSDAGGKSTVSAVAQFITEEEHFEKDQVYYLEYTLTSVGQKIPETFKLTLGGQNPMRSTPVSCEKGVYTVSAVWRFVIGEPASYKVSFDANGHGQAPEAVEVPAGTILRYEWVDLDQENQAEGEDLYALLTWRDASGTSWEDVCVESDVTLTAEWAKLLNRIDITFAVPHAGEECPAPVVPADAVYSISDWYVMDEHWSDITELEAGKKYIVTVNLAVDEDAEIYLERFEFEDVWEDYLGTCYINGELQDPGVGGYNIHYEDRAFEISFVFEPLAQEEVGDTVDGDAAEKEVN